MIFPKLIVSKLIAFLTLMLLCMGVFVSPAFASAAITPVNTEDTEVFDGESVESTNQTDMEISDLDDMEETENEKPTESESAIPTGSGFRPFTPPGTGTVVDNAVDGDGKEFYTISTADGDIFYLIIDRQRNSQNVYFLNVVTESDLIALAEKNKREITGGTSAIPPVNQQGGENPDPSATPEPEPVKPADNTAMYIILGVAVLGIGGAAYYFKIVKGRKNAPAETDDDADEDFDEDEYGYEPEENEDENEEGDESE